MSSENQNRDGGHGENKFDAPKVKDEARGGRLTVKVEKRKQQVCVHINIRNACIGNIILFLVAMLI